MSTRTPIRKNFSLQDARREFWRHPSPWMISGTLVAALTARIIVGDWQISDALVPLVMLAVFPFFEWVVHVTILHWKPRHVAGLTVDPLLSRKHREHHVNPRDIPLIFIPWKALFWILPVALAISVFAFPRIGLGLTYLTFVATLGIVYEWTHYLIHSDYKPKGRIYKAIWRNHRNHHYKNEHYWFTVTSSGTADRVLGTCPKPEDVPSSPTAKNLHAIGS
ncbi:sterol desaturase family protein [Antrihabitans sp. YC2-6]|uniref:sterol desaturase family protein n=1 Tax=Antrihabitans sp. YC2-6 TaxID=2799498 RepID=UPI0018F53268|nr:sterol desaturase family protein [Antrihabitans sp. YC2-6]MBJ8346283.1 sterol desaturase family protein [Antrihabitans sp. YC2-6]